MAGWLALVGWLVSSGWSGGDDPALGDRDDAESNGGGDGNDDDSADSDVDSRSTASAAVMLICCSSFSNFPALVPIFVEHGVGEGKRFAIPPV